MSKKDSRALMKGTEKARHVASNEKVGKGKPPEASKWRRGESGNPSGRPSAHRAVIVASVKEMLAQVDPKLKKSLFERLLEQCARRALQGSKWHMGVLLDYGLGKPTQMLEHAGGINLTNIIEEARRRSQVALPALPSVPAPTDANGAIRRAQAAAEAAEQGTASEDAAEQPARPKIRVEPWAN